MAKFNTNSNTYIIVYATIMVVAVAFLLAFVSSSLEDYQKKNVKNDVKSQILASIHVQAEDVDAKYAEIIKDNLWDGNSLKEVDANDFKISYNSEIKNGRYHVFVANVDGTTKYILPVYGQGLWGPIWGYLALNEDKQTVYGAYFNHESETAGLGAEIKDSKTWREKFRGKKITDGKTIILGVKKSSDKPDPECEVDGITGATLTSDGVDNMFKEGLKNYLTFINKK